MKFIRMVWPSITDVESASKASGFCCMTVWVLSLLAAINLVLSYILITRAFRENFPVSNLIVAFIGIMLFALVGYFIRKNSKIAVFIPLSMMLLLGTGPNIVIGLVQVFRVVYMNERFKPMDFGSWYGIASAVVLLIIYLNGIRGVFAYHGYLEKALYKQRLTDDGRWSF